MRANDRTQVRVRSPEDTWSPVCSEGWTGDWSAAACSQLGFAGIVATNISDYGEEEEPLAVLSLNVSLVAEEGATLLQAATVPMDEMEEEEEEEDKNCKEVVRLQCQQQGELFLFVFLLFGFTTMLTCCCCCSCCFCFCCCCC